MNKKELYESIMRQVSYEVKKTLNEAWYSAEGYWGIPGYDQEADKNHNIHVSLKQFTEGGRETLESNWKISLIQDNGLDWTVSATCINSEISRFNENDYIEFDLDKDTKIWDLDTALKDALFEQGY